MTKRNYFTNKLDYKKTNIVQNTNFNRVRLDNSSGIKLFIKRNIIYNKIKYKKKRDIMKFSLQKCGSLSFSLRFIFYSIESKIVGVFLFSMARFQDLNDQMENLNLEEALLQKLH